MKEKNETITIKVKKSKAKAFLSMLKLLDFVELETPEEKIARYLSTSPDNVPLGDDDIMKLIKGVHA